MNILLFDDHSTDKLLPLTFTRPVAELRVGIISIREKWQKIAPDNDYSYLTRDYLSRKFPATFKSDNLLISGSVIPTRDIAEVLFNLEKGKLLRKDSRPIGLKLSDKEAKNFNSLNLDEFAELEYPGEVLFLDHPWQIFQWNGDQIRSDLNRIRDERKSQELSSTNKLLGKDIFIEEGARIEFATLNTTTGPIYIGKNVEIMEGAVIRGPFAICEGSVVKLSAKIYGPTTIGPRSKVGGEINNSVFQGNSNKAHDGFLGNSVIGEWCNLGADTNNSNLKNNYAEVRLWSYPDEKFISTGLQFCGLIMGDHKIANLLR
jgi:UDP-N-acetylglucosamine diphosphorylase/glucosamine-1-phosphate N-acetyltransferase